MASSAFNHPVVVPVGGNVIPSQRGPLELGGVQQSGLGSVVQSAAYGDECMPALPGWSVTAGHVAAPESRRRSGAIPTFAPAPKRARRPSVAGAPRRLAPAGSISDVEDGGAHCGPPFDRPLEPRAAAPCRRRHQPGQASPSSDGMLPVLVACVLRCCGFPSSTPVSETMCPVTATIVGDPNSRSRAIALRFGGAKRDAVLWV